MNKLPEDPIMLMSFINMKLRDAYPSLDLLCEDLEADREQIESRLREAGFEYDQENNRFW